jgi:hypothetical protein
MVKIPLSNITEKNTTMIQQKDFSHAALNLAGTKKLVYTAMHEAISDFVQKRT